MTAILPHRSLATRRRSHLWVLWSDGRVDTLIARATAATLEPVHATVYFAAEPQEEYEALGLDVRGNRAVGYFPGRAAALGAVGPAVVQATFFVFSPLACAFGIQGVWDQVGPADVQAARRRGIDRTLRRLCGTLLDTPDVVEAVELARTAAEACRPEGRTLFAAHAALDWPTEPHLQLWHALSLLREYRGDGHIAALLDAGITAPQAGVLDVAFGTLWTRRSWQATRAYSDEQWDTALAELRERGWVERDGEGLTDAGRAAREAVEHRTDVTSMAPWERIGQDGATRLRELVRPLSRAVVDGGGMTMAGRTS
jgi:hypothetical protein